MIGLGELGSRIECRELRESDRMRNLLEEGEVSRICWRHKRMAVSSGEKTEKELHSRKECMVESIWKAQATLLLVFESSVEQRE